MKHAALYSARIRQLFKTLQRRFGKPRISAPRSPEEEILYAVLSRDAPEVQAAGALARIRAAVVDLNELRVTPARELEEILGKTFPMARTAAERIHRMLNAIFNRRHSLDLAFLAEARPRDQKRFLESLDGADPYIVALFLLRQSHPHGVPLDPQMLEYLRRDEMIDPGASLVDAQEFLAKAVRASQIATFFALLKRHAAAHVSRLPPVAPPVTTTTLPEPAPAAVASNNPAAQGSGNSRSTKPPVAASNKSKSAAGTPRSTRSQSRARRSSKTKRRPGQKKKTRVAKTAARRSSSRRRNSRVRPRHRAGKRGKRVSKRR
jgi:hypothetical protein